MRFHRHLLSLVLLLVGASAHAFCTSDQMVNPINDISWDCVFPISIMGFSIDAGGDKHPPDDSSSDSTCNCKGEKGYQGDGFLITWWEPARMVDTVNDQWCMVGLGMDLSSSTSDTGSGTGGGSSAGGGGGSYEGPSDTSIASHSTTWGYKRKGQLRRDASKVAFQHFHFYVMPFWEIMGLMIDASCESGETADIAMVSEVRPDWHDDEAASEYYPETSLMANPVTVVACMADAAMTLFNKTIDALYWCEGSWGLTYPMTGHITTTDYLEANAGIAARSMYVQGRTGMLYDRAINYCSSVNPPIWVKSHWRIQLAKPTADNYCHIIGRPGLLWTFLKNYAGSEDNYNWIIFRKVRCCAVYD